MNIKIRNAVFNGVAHEYQCHDSDVRVTIHGGQNGCSIQCKDGFETEAVVMLGEAAVDAIVREKLHSMNLAQLIHFTLKEPAVTETNTPI